MTTVREYFVCCATQRQALWCASLRPFSHHLASNHQLPDRLDENRHLDVRWWFILEHVAHLSDVLQWTKQTRPRPCTWRSCMRRGTGNRTRL